MNKKNIFLWTLYDFANSIVTVTFFLYFSQWLVTEKGVADIWYNLLFTGASIILLFTSPILGIIADRNGRQLKYLNNVTLLTFLMFVGASLAALFLSGKVWIAALFFLLANYLYQLSFTFYNALLHYIAPSEKQGWISGVGQSGNWIGQIAGIFISLPLASGAVYIFGTRGIAQTFLPSAVIFIALSLPLMFFFKKITTKNANAQNDSDNIATTINLKAEYKNQWQVFKELIREPNMKLFLLAFFFFNDAILTAQINYPIYLQQVFGVSDKTKSLLLVGILATSTIGALICGWVSDKIGLKKTLMIVLGSFVVILPALGLSSSFSVFVPISIAMGILYGAIWSVTRAAMTALCPKDKLNYGFSFYTLAERTSTFVGPISWGIIVSLLTRYGAIRYRVAVISMAIFVAIGIYLLRKVKITQQ